MNNKEKQNDLNYEYYDKRFWQLQGLADSYSKNAINFLSFVNGGATVATLALIGAVVEYRYSCLVYLILFGYMFGTILVGLLYIHLVRKYEELMTEWISDYNNRYIRGRITFDELIAEDEKRVKKNQNFPWVLGYCSFGLFVGTSIVAAGFLILSAVK